MPDAEADVLNTPNDAAAGLYVQNSQTTGCLESVCQCVCVIIRHASAHIGHASNVSVHHVSARAQKRGCS
jgi:hypothetical protein